MHVNLCLYCLRTNLKPCTFIACYNLHSQYMTVTLHMYLHNTKICKLIYWTCLQGLQHVAGQSEEELKLAELEGLRSSLGCEQERCNSLQQELSSSQVQLQELRKQQRLQVWT